MRIFGTGGLTDGRTDGSGSFLELAIPRPAVVQRSVATCPAAPAPVRSILHVHVRHVQRGFNQRELSRTDGRTDGHGLADIFNSGERI